MAEGGTPKPTGRRVRGYISDLVELSAERALWTAVVYHEDYREDAALQAAAASIRGFSTQPSVGVARLRLLGPGVFGFATGEIRSTRELIGAAADGVGWAAAVDWLIGAMEILQGATASGLASHGSLDPHRILIQYDGTVQIIGFGLPRLDLVDFLDDATLLPVTESLRFTAPESLEGAAEDFTTDLFVLGLIAVELATGDPVYEPTEAAQLLARAADGEGRAALEGRDIPPAVLAWLGPMLEPWPDERHPSIDKPLEAARACRTKLSGPSLGEAMEAHADIGSSVEVDLPRGWKLPAAEVLEEAVDPEAFAQEREARVAEAQALLPPLEDALKQVDKALAKLASPPDWSDTPEAEERRAEARGLGDRARQGARDARDVVGRMEKAADAAELASLAETLDDAVAQARGGAEEGARTAASALELREGALAELAEQAARQEQEQARQKAFMAARKQLDGWKDEAAPIGAVEAPPKLTHAADPAVAAHLQALAEATKDLGIAVSTLQGIQLEEGDDPDAVLDAARGHLDAARQCRERLDRALAEAIEADRAAAEALDAAAAAEAAAREIHRADLLASGERVKAAFARASQAFEQAEAASEGFEEELAGHLAPLRERAELLRGRHDNWTEMAAGADDDASAEVLEDLVHTGNAEADFAEADIEGLEALVQAFEEQREQVAAARQAYEEQRNELLERVERARAALANAEQQTALAEAFQVPDDIGAEPIQAEHQALSAACGPARAVLDEADALIIDTDGMPEQERVETLEAHATQAAEGAAASTAALAALKDRIEGIRKQRLEAEEAHRAAVDRALELQQELVTLLVDRTPPDPDEDGDVAARLEGDRQAVVVAQQGFPEAPSVDIEGDPAAAIGALETALDGARSAATRLQEVEAHLAARTEQVRALVAQLAKVAAKAETVADETASLAGKARELSIDTKGRWPDLQPRVEALEQAIAAVEARAKEASEAAEASASADDVETAKAQARQTEEAHASATEALARVQEQAAALNQAIEAARVAQAEADREAHQNAVTTARALADEAGALLEQLDEAIQRAGELLENSPSQSARSAWEDAEPAIDATQERLAAVDRLLQAVVDADAPEKAQQALAKIVAAVEPSRQAVHEAVAAADEAGRLAEAETEANVALHEGLHREAEAMADHLRFIHESVEHGQSHGGVKGVPALVAKLEQQLAHAQDAAAEVAAGITGVNDADGAKAREQAAQVVRNQLARVVAAKNTAKALREQLDARLAEARRAEEEQRVAAIAEGQERIEAAQPLLEKVRAAAEGLAELRSLEHLTEAFRAVDGAVLACEPLLAGMVSLGNELEHVDNARRAVGLTKQIVQKSQELEQAHAEALAAVAAVREAHAAHQQAVAEERQQRIEAHQQAVSTVREAHRRLAGMLGEVESELLEAEDLDLEPEDDIRIVRDEVGRMALFLDGLPGELGPDGLETAREVVAGIEGAVERVETAIEAFRDRLARARQAAHALAGIRGAATAVRRRYAELEGQLNDARAGLQRVSERAPVAGSSQGHREAADQLEELTTTLADANTSLDDLNNANDADEAQALLEVAEASLDIAASLFEFALPMVQRTIEAGEAEVRAMTALAERREQAEAALELAMQDLPGADRADRELASAGATALHLEGAFGTEALAASLETLAEAAADWNTARAVLDQPIESPEGADELEALEAIAEQRTAERSRLQQAEVALERALAAVQEQVRAVEVVLEERAARVGRVQEQLEALRKALALVQDDVARGLAEARELAAGLSVEPVNKALAAVEERAGAVAAASLPSVGTDDPDAAEAALLEAEQILDEARTASFDERVAALRKAVETARAEAAERAERLAELRVTIEASAERLAELKEAFAAALEQAEPLAEPWPLETMEPMEALRVATASVQAAPLPEIPGPPDEPTPERVAELTALATTLGGSLEQAEAHELEPLVEAVRVGVAAGEQAARNEKEALQAMLDRIQRANDLLASRQAKAGERLLELSDLLEMPELAPIATELQQAVEAFSLLSIPGPVPETLDAAGPYAENAEAIATSESPHVQLFEQLVEGARQAEAERADLRDRVRTAADAVQARVEAGREMLERYREQAGSERLKATLRAIEEAVEQLESARFDVDVDALDRASLEEAAGDAELAVQAVAMIDIEGLEEEANDALQKDAEEAARLEEQRASTQEQASAAVDAALLQLTMEVEARRDAVADLGDEPSPQAAPHRQKAREALAQAQAIMGHLESLQVRLQQPVPMAEAVSASFDAESQAEIAIQHLDTVDAAVKAAQNETQALARVRGQFPRIVSRVEELVGAARKALAELPGPEGEMATTIAEELQVHGAELDRLESETASCVETLETSSSALEAETEFDRLRGLAKQAQAVSREVRHRANDLHEAIETERQLQAARRAEAFAEGRRRAELALKRAETAADAVGAAVVRVSERAEGLGDAAEEARTRLAAASQDALDAVDRARTAVASADDDLDAPEAAVRAADAAEAALAGAEDAEAEVAMLLEAARQAELEEAARRDGEVLARRDEALPGLNERVENARAEVDQVRQACASAFDDEEAEAVRAHALSTVEYASGALETALERIALLAQARAEDVDDFLEDAGQAVHVAEQSLGAVRSARIQLDQAAKAAALRGRELALEEARGRAWEACQLAKRLAKDLTLARNALPPLPHPPPPEFREAADRLAEVERRLWRAGQRADEARERAGSTEDLETAQQAAAAAETAVGSSRRWEREIDAALDQLSNLLKGPGYTGVREIPPAAAADAIERTEPPEDEAKQSRIEKLRRGRHRPDQTDARERLDSIRDSRPPFAPSSEEPTNNSPTEKLLQRLRKGRSHGETGRERLKRLRDQRRSLLTDDPDATEFPSVGEVEEHASTVAASEAEVQRVAAKSQQRAERRDKRAEMIEALKKKQEHALDEGRTQVFTREHLAEELADDAATQMFTREMLDDHLAGELDDEDDPVTRESDGPPEWADEDGSTKYSTMSPRDLRQRDED